MILESERLLAEDLERLEQAIADRLLEEPKAVSYPDLQLQLFISCRPPSLSSSLRFVDESLSLYSEEADANAILLSISSSRSATAWPETIK